VAEEVAGNQLRMALIVMTMTMVMTVEVGMAEVVPG
jgi:hypothetical protein